MKRIRLTQGKFALVDDRDFSWLNQWRWFFRKDGYAGRTAYPRSYKVPETIRMHRLILGAKTGSVVDHKNQNKLDNRRENLRVATRSQNRANSSKVLGSSGFRGVRRHPSGWVATIMVGGKSRHLGLFKEKVLAAKAYDKAALQAHGEFAVPNIPKC